MLAFIPGCDRPSCIDPWCDGRWRGGDVPALLGSPAFDNRTMWQRMWNCRNWRWGRQVPGMPWEPANP